MMGGIDVIKAQNGFTLTEILVAVVILGVVVAMLPSLFGSSLISIWRAGDHQDALIEAQVLMENVLAGAELDNPNVSIDLTYTLGGQVGTLYTVTIPWDASSREVKLTAFRVDQ